jgi:hypothetical protein
MAVQLEGIKPPQSGRIEIHVSADINITARTARQRVSRLVASELGNLLFGGDPTLVVGERVVWRVPVTLAYPDTGPLGQIGTLDVDVETGQVMVTPEQLAKIEVEAHVLAQRAAAGSA